MEKIDVIIAFPVAVGALHRNPPDMPSLPAT
ncbi:uncharacterized protein METZ01_LOCUS82690, partial [marine metagenome]